MQFFTNLTLPLEQCAGDQVTYGVCGSHTDTSYDFDGALRFLLYLFYYHPNNAFWTMCSDCILAPDEDLTGGDGEYTIWAYNSA